MKFRNGYKHQVNFSDVLLLSKRFNLVLEHDKNANEDGKYLVKSLLYFKFYFVIMKKV